MSNFVTAKEVIVTITINELHGTFGVSPCPMALRDGMLAGEGDFVVLGTYTRVRERVSIYMNRLGGRDRARDSKQGKKIYVQGRCCYHYHIEHEYTHVSLNMKTTG